MGDLTTHFSTVEFKCHGHGKRGHRAHPTYVDPPLLVVLEAIRSFVGRPLPIVSGNRCAMWNKRVGGASDSRHLHFDAADIPAGYIRRADAERLGAKGTGVSGGWVTHVDTRPGPVSRWSYD
jgi:uncharacterized protein YcbK (DUF882 family)